MEGHAIAAAGLDVAVQAVVGDVELAADEPLGERRVRPIEDLRPWLVPGQGLGLARPEALVVPLGLLVDPRVRPERPAPEVRSEEDTSELQSRQYLVCRLL